MRPEEIERLIAHAGKAAKRALAGHSGFRVGAAILSTDGTVFDGCNIENPSLMLTMCAERVALLKALSEGHVSFPAMAIVSGDGRYCYPCGPCRQMLAEFAPGLMLFLDSEKGIKKYTIEELLPYPFSL